MLIPDPYFVLTGQQRQNVLLHRLQPFRNTVHIYSRLLGPARFGAKPGIRRHTFCSRFEINFPYLLSRRRNLIGRPAEITADGKNRGHN